GDHVRFKRGSQFSGMLTLTDSGTEDAHIVLTDYGDPADPAPAFTNRAFDPALGEFGNCIRLQGSFIRVENLYFHETVAGLSGRIGFETMWELGAVYIDKAARHCVVRNNEFVDCGVGIKSYGEGAVIQHNLLRDCNRILKEWNWGPIAIWLGGDHQDVGHNRIFNYRAVDPRINWGPNGYGSGADGSAFEIDDARVAKTNIVIHHNYTRDNQGFLEVTWSDVARNPDYRGIRIHHNVSDDYQQFVALWRGAECRIEHNTIIRRKVNANDWGVFNLTQFNSRNLVRNNLVVVEQGVVIFNLGRDGNARPNTVIESNLYFAASGELKMGLEGPGQGAVFGDPMFVNYARGSEAADFALTAASPAINRGLPLGYETDFRGPRMVTNALPDLGAFEFMEPTTR
ncbi:MAG TPA: choice-of-anchor Q domain-containing protein, partial [Verrucomicrobiae bacterium]|nr:choice-of-anchor Q domain-containing protein [Verrucomicrobiae bacterium]